MHKWTIELHQSLFKTKLKPWLFPYLVESLASANKNCLNLDVDHFLFLVHYQVSDLQGAYGRWLT